MSTETLIKELSGRSARRTVDIDKLIRLIFDYFGEEDGRLVLEIALFFKYPSCYQWLGKAAIEKLEEGSDG